MVNYQRTSWPGCARSPQPGHNHALPGQADDHAPVVYAYGQNAGVVRARGTLLPYACPGVDHVLGSCVTKGVPKSKEHSIVKSNSASFLRGAVRAARRNHLSLFSYRSAGSFLCVFSIGSTGSILSIGSAGSILSIGSVGSILSIGSAGSILSIGSAGKILAMKGKRRK